MTAGDYSNPRMMRCSGRLTNEIGRFLMAANVGIISANGLYPLEGIENVLAIVTQSCHTYHLRAASVGVDQ